MEKQAQAMLRTMQGKLNKTREREKFHHSELQKACEHTKVAKSQAINYYDRLQHMTQKYNQVVAEKEELVQKMERKSESEDVLARRVFEAERIAVDASEQAIEIAETVREKYEPERMRLKEAQDEIEQLKKMLRRAQHDLKIAKTPVDSKATMSFTRSGSTKSFDSHQPPTSPQGWTTASVSAPRTPTGMRTPTSSRLTLPAERAHRSSCSTCPSRTEDGSPRRSAREVGEQSKLEFESKLRRSRQQEQLARKSQEEAAERAAALEEKARVLTNEKKTLVDRMGSLRDRNRQLQSLLERQQSEFEVEINELKQHLRRKKVENRNVFHLWKQSLDETAPKGGPSFSFNLDDSDILEGTVDGLLPPPLLDDTGSPGIDSPSADSRASPMLSARESPIVSARGSPMAQAAAPLLAPASAPEPAPVPVAVKPVLPAPLGSLSGSAVPQRGSLHDLGPKKLPHPTIRQLIAHEVEKGLDEKPRPERPRIAEAAHTSDHADEELPKSWMVDLSEDQRHEELELEYKHFADRESQDLKLHEEDFEQFASAECRELESEAVVEDCELERMYLEDVECREYEQERTEYKADDLGDQFDKWEDPEEIFTNFGPLSPVIESPDRVSFLNRSWVEYVDQNADANDATEDYGSVVASKGTSDCCGSYFDDAVAVSPSASAEQSDKAPDDVAVPEEHDTNEQDTTNGHCAAHASSNDAILDEKMDGLSQLQQALKQSSLSSLETPTTPPGFEKQRVAASVFSRMSSSQSQ